MGVAQTNTNGHVSFVYQNIQVAIQSNVAANTNSVLTLPQVIAYDYQNGLQQSGRNPGGSAYAQPPNVAFTAPGNANASVVLLDDGFDSNYTKNGAFIVVLSGTTTALIPLTNTQTNTNSYAGDTTFATVCKAVAYNLSGLDGVNSASMAIGTNGTNGCAIFGVNNTNGFTLQGSCKAVFWQLNGTTVAANAQNIQITPTAGGTFAVVLRGS